MLKITNSEKDKKMCRSNYIYYRIFGYVTTILVHVINTLYLSSCLTGEVMKDPQIRFFASMQRRYFTVWTFILQIVYAVLGLTCDYLTLKNAENKEYRLPKHLKGCRDTMFAGIQWPSSLLVSSMFWSLFYIDRNLVFPVILDQVVPYIPNHIIHTVIVPITAWELAFQPRIKPMSHRRNIAHLVLHFCLYHGVLFYTYYDTGKWVYPLFNRLHGTVYFPLFMATVLAALLIYYYLQWPLTKLFHPKLERTRNKTL